MNQRRDYFNYMKHLSEEKTLLMIYEICYVLFSLFGYKVEFLPCRRRSTKKRINNFVVQSIARSDGQEIYNCMNDYPVKEIEECSVFDAVCKEKKKKKYYTVDYENFGKKESVHYEGKYKRDFERTAPIHIALTELNKYHNINFEITTTKIPNEKKQLPFTFKIKPINLYGIEYFTDYRFGNEVHQLLIQNIGGVKLAQNIGEAKLPQVNANDSILNPMGFSNDQLNVGYNHLDELDSNDQLSDQLNVGYSPELNSNYYPNAQVDNYDYLNYDSSMVNFDSSMVNFGDINEAEPKKDMSDVNSYNQRL